jgi:diguanylate cyclase (GGDEF)-like protein/PAS domain S-box-containing protein
MTSQSNTRIRMVFGYVVALCVLSWASALLYQDSLQFRENRRWVSHTQDVLDEFQKLRSNLREAAGAHRGYLLTGDESDLRTYASSVGEARLILDRLQALTVDNPRQQASIAQLRPHLVDEFQEWERSIELRDQRTAPVLGPAAGSAGLREMEQIRRLIDIMQNDENELLATRTARYEASVSRNERFLATDVALQFVLLTLGFFFIYRDFVNRSRFAVAIGKANNLLKAVVEGSGDGILAKDVNGIYQVINEAGGRFMGWPTKEILGRTDADLFDGESAQKLVAEDREVMASGGTKEYERTLTAAGQTKIIASSKAPYRDGAGQIAGVVGVFRDVTERNRADQELRETKEAYRRLVEEGQGLICMHDLQGNLLSVNRAAARILGYAPRNGEHGNLRRFLPSQDIPNFELYLREIDKHGEHAGTMRILDQAGTIRYWAYRNRRVLDAGKPPYVVGHAQDITAQIRAERALKASEEKLREALENEKNLARLDFLTQIPNRRAFAEVLQSEAARSRRYKRPLTLAYIDLDNFKQINDHLGHETGDELLSLIAQTILANIRSTDTVARLGGDEFALLLPETEKDAAYGVVTKLRRILLETVEARQWPVTLSIGVATFVKPVDSVAMLVKVADDLMYSAKGQGKNCIIASSVEAHVGD